MSEPLVSEPLVSVVIPTLRRRARLWRALESVAAQSYAHVEVVVANDGGAPLDGLVRRYQATFGRPIRAVVLAEQRGVAAARNAGIGAASGTCIALLDDDDRFLPGHLARLAAALMDDPAAALVYEDVLLRVEDGTEEDAEGALVATCRFGRPYDRDIFDHDDFIVPSASMLRRAAFVAIGGFDEHLVMCEDWDLLLRLRQHGALRYVPGAIGTEYSVRLRAADHLGAQFDATRRAVLDLLAQRYSLPHLEPKTFLDVARDLGFTLVPAGGSASL